MLDKLAKEESEIETVETLFEMSLEKHQRKKERLSS